MKNNSGMISFFKIKWTSTSLDYNWTFSKGVLFG